MEQYKEQVKQIVLEAINGLRGANLENVKKVIKRSHDRATELSKNKNPEDWTQKDMDDSVKEFKQRQYAEKKFNVQCASFMDKFNYIKETIATMMDVQPIMPVGQEHPAKKEKRCKDQKDTERS